MSVQERRFTAPGHVLAGLGSGLLRCIGTALVPIMSMSLANPAHAFTLGAQAKIYNAEHHQVGTARFVQLGHGNVTVQVRVRHLPPGFHGFHLHAAGECVAPFTSAGGHFDQGSHPHGSHSGDLPVLLVQDDGTANAIFSTDRFEVADLFDANGSAVIIHAEPDNYANIPARYSATGPDAATLSTGDAGARIACGVVEKLIER